MTAIKQASFVGGELTPSLHSRVDINKYTYGLKTLRNFFVMRQGGASNRSGTEYIATVKDSSKRVKLIPFIFNSDQTYILEFGDSYIRFYRNGSQIVVSGITAWDSGTNYVVGDLASSGGVNYYCISGHINHTPPNGTYWYALTGSIYEIPSSYAEAHLQDIQFVQSGDIITLTHQSYAPMELRRSGHTSWVLSTITFAPSISAPTNVTATGSPTFPVTTYSVTAVNASGEESFAGFVGTANTPSSGSKVTVSWTGSSGALYYRVYRADLNGGLSGGTGYIGESGGTTFVDDGSIPDHVGFAPSSTAVFGSTNNYPKTALYSQQRLYFGGTINNPEKIWASRIGSLSNFYPSRFDTSSTNDAESFNFTLVGRRVNQIKYFSEIRRFLCLSSEGEWVIAGNDYGVITPTAINAQQQTFNGSGDITPILVNGDLLYLQARNSIIRNLSFDVNGDSYNGTDLTIFSSHLFDNYSIQDWSFQLIPNSIIWAVRNDGILLGLTYIKEHEILAWHRHDFQDAEVENVCVIPSTNEDDVYLILKRTVNSSTVRYIEKMSTRNINDIEDCNFMDSSLSYDGTNTGSITMTLSGGTDWDYQENLTLTASSSYFISGDVGNEIHITGTDGTIIRCSIKSYSSGTTVIVKTNKTVPASMRNTAILTWGKAVDVVTGLSHLEGKNVSVFADGFVVANPNNSSYQVLTVSGGSITLPIPHVVIRVGIPYISDIETLNIDIANGETLADKKKLITKVSCHVENSRGLWIGSEPPSDDDTDPLENLNEIKLRENETYDEQISLSTKVIDVNINSTWNQNGRVFLRQVDPLPLTVLSIIPTGLIPIQR